MKIIKSDLPIPIVIMPRSVSVENGRHSGDCTIVIKAGTTTFLTDKQKKAIARKVKKLMAESEAQHD
jgi:hypothetical protein